jgi:hypothetical protein
VGAEGTFPGIRGAKGEWESSILPPLNPTWYLNHSNNLEKTKTACFNKNFLPQNWVYDSEILPGIRKS